ncbi:MAG: LysM peptidoglycan-binding domain-containing protein [Proteobacteria bacterium]|nr:LysM peptidoglycan-binding domain-containing protein [Pseudomonadota bacterium]MBU1233743.1 LysM peptidoglycan-binding domain-containing protein [Pseudomonadota bacterium]MBU1419248.1 LysM peptidoglycan-binding domain-containing protein [Pseudomonadota bacterium]MBU1453876.1 LysM peptidoglycan-binding domain-containing protein [Pseudomonadota bacterium]
MRSKYPIVAASHFFQPWCLATSLFFFVLYLWTFLPAISFAGEAFPRYPVIENNVRFWEKIYHQYSTSQAVVHDSYDLSKIYAVLPIIDQRIPGAAKINAPIFKAVKKKYARILDELARGVTPRSDEGKRIAAMFRNDKPKRLQEAATSIRIQIGQKERFLEGFIRSGAYLADIRKIFRDHGLPEDLAYLPHVESSFNLKAYSKFGASGIWQFTRDTGRQFLTINYEIDERQDPILASRAAAQFLKKNHQLLGSWPLALTAYNYGPAGMLRAQKAHTTYEKIFSSYDQGYFKFASRNFYSEFLAALSVAKKLEKDPSLSLHRPAQVMTITLPGYIAVDDICNYFNVTPDTIKTLNPALRSSVLLGEKHVPKGYTLRLPHSRQQKKLLATLPQHLYHKNQKPTKFYRVRSGDTAGKIAIAHGVSLKALMQANKLDDRASVLVGQNLRIPERNTKNRQAEIQNISSTQQKRTVPAINMPSVSSKQQTVPLLIKTKKKEATWKSVQKARGVILGELSVRPALDNSNMQGTITILPEESVELLANWLQISDKSLRTLNKLPPDHLLQADERIQIPLTNVSASEFEEKRFDFHLETEEDFYSAFKIVGVKVYEVSKGDTIWEICRNKFDLPFWLLKKYNANLDFSNLRSSQQLTIPIVKAI